MSVAEQLEKPLPKPERDLVGYAAARTLEALLEALLALEFLEKGYTRNAAGKAFQAWKALTAVLLALNTDKMLEKIKSGEERKWIEKIGIARVPTSKLKVLALTLEEVGNIRGYHAYTSVALDLHDYQYHGPDPDMALSRYRSRSEAARDIAYLTRRIAEIVDGFVKPKLEKAGRWGRELEEALQMLRKKLLE